MGNILINKNYGDIYNVQSGATVVARGAEAAMMREQILAQQNAEPAANADFDGQEISDEVSDVEIRMKKVRHAILQMREEKCPYCKNNFFGSGQAYQYAYLYALMTDGKCCKNIICHVSITRSNSCNIWKNWGWGRYAVTRPSTTD